VQLVGQSPDWFYVRSVLPAPPTKTVAATPQVRRGSPGDRHGVSETDGGEYSIKAKYPPGKWYYYERIFIKLTYAIFGAEAGWLEVYQLDASRYQLVSPDANRRYWIASIVISGCKAKANRTGYWLRWWDESRQMLL